MKFLRERKAKKAIKRLQDGVSTKWFKLAKVWNQKLGLRRGDRVEPEARTTRRRGNRDRHFVGGRPAGQKGHPNAWTLEGTIRTGFKGLGQQVTKGEIGVGQATGGRNLMASTVVASLHKRCVSDAVDEALRSLRTGQHRALFLGAYHDSTPWLVSFGALQADVMPHARYLKLDPESGKWETVPYERIRTASQHAPRVGVVELFAQSWTVHLGHPEQTASQEAAALPKLALWGHFGFRVSVGLATWPFNFYLLVLKMDHAKGRRLSSDIVCSGSSGSRKVSYWTSHHEMLTRDILVPPRIIQNTGASTVYAAFNKGVPQLSVDSITELCADLKYILIAECPDNASSNKRKMYATAARLPANALMIIGGCVVHHAQRAVNAIGGKVIGDLYSAKFLTHLNSHYAHLFRTLRKLVDEELLVIPRRNVREEDVRQWEVHTAGVMSHTTLRKQLHTRGRLTGLGVGFSAGGDAHPLEGAVAKLLAFCNGDIRVQRCIHIEVGCCESVEQTKERVFLALVECYLLLGQSGLPALGKWGTMTTASSHVAAGILVHGVLPRTFQKAFPTFHAADLPDMDDTCHNVPDSCCDHLLFCTERVVLVGEVSFAFAMWRPCARPRTPPLTHKLRQHSTCWAPYLFRLRGWRGACLGAWSRQGVRR